MSRKDVAIPIVIVLLIVLLLAGVVGPLREESSVAKNNGVLIARFFPLLS